MSGVLLRRTVSLQRLCLVCDVRSFASLHGTHELPVDPSGIIEMREYTMQPQGLKPYLQLVGQHVERRKQLSPFLGMFTCDTGGSLTTLHHFYHYRDYAHRESARAAMARDKEWQDSVIDSGRVHTAAQSSSILRHLSFLHEAGAAGSASAFQPRNTSRGKGTYALLTHRISRLDPEFEKGYGTVDMGDWLEQVYTRLQTLRDRGVQLVFAGGTAVGVRSRVVELLRFPSIQHFDDCMEARLLAQHSADRKATVQLLQPTAGSPWQ